MRMIEGGEAAFNAITAFEVPGIREQYHRNMEHLRAQEDVSMQTYLAQLDAMYQQVYSDSAMRYAQQAVALVANQNDPLAIYPITSLELAQQANARMMAYIMSDPTIHQHYQDGEIEGYYGTFYDAYPDRRGLEHPVYRIVMDGIVTTDDEDALVITEAFEMDPVERLSVMQQHIVRHSIEYVKKLIRARKGDPTSPLQGELS